MRTLINTNMSLPYTMRYSSGNVSVCLSTVLFVTGCFSDEPFQFDQEEETGSADTTTPADTETGTNATVPVDSENGTDTTPSGPKILLSASDYEGFQEANDSLGPAGTPPIVESNHTGWKMARCFDCHGVNAPYEAAGHDPTMQYWAWSCARGFPGGACHGHGVNGSVMFNHAPDKERDPNFNNCTQSGCHDTFITTKERENHGMNEILTDEFCHACHDYYWEEWPDGAVK